MVKKNSINVLMKYQYIFYFKSRSNRKSKKARQSIIDQ